MRQQQQQQFAEDSIRARHDTQQSIQFHQISSHPSQQMGSYRKPSNNNNTIGNTNYVAQSSTSQAQSQLPPQVPAAMKRKETSQARNVSEAANKNLVFHHANSCSKKSVNTSSATTIQSTPITSHRLKQSSEKQYIEVATTTATVQDSLNRGTYFHQDLTPKQSKPQQHQKYQQQLQPQQQQHMHNLQTQPSSVCEVSPFVLPSGWLTSASAEPKPSSGVAEIPSSNSNLPKKKISSGVEYQVSSHRLGTGASQMVLQVSQQNHINSGSSNNNNNNNYIPNVQNSNWQYQQQKQQSQNSAEEGKGTLSTTRYPSSSQEITLKTPKNPIRTSKNKVPSQGDEAISLTPRIKLDFSENQLAQIATINGNATNTAHPLDFENQFSHSSKNLAAAYLTKNTLFQKDGSSYLAPKSLINNKSTSFKGMQPSLGAAGTVIAGGAAVSTEQTTVQVSCFPSPKIDDLMEVSVEPIHRNLNRGALKHRINLDKSSPQISKIQLPQFIATPSCSYSETLFKGKQSAAAAAAAAATATVSVGFQGQQFKHPRDRILNKECETKLETSVFLQQNQDVSMNIEEEHLEDSRILDEKVAKMMFRANPSHLTESQSQKEQMISFSCSNCARMQEVQLSAVLSQIRRAVQNSLASIESPFLSDNFFNKQFSGTKEQFDRSAGGGGGIFGQGIDFNELTQKSLHEKIDLHSMQVAQQYQNLNSLIASTNSSVSSNSVDGMYRFNGMMMAKKDGVNNHVRQSVSGEGKNIDGSTAINSFVKSLKLQVERKDMQIEGLKKKIDELSSRISKQAEEITELRVKHETALREVRSVQLENNNLIKNLSNVLTIKLKNVA